MHPGGWYRWTTASSKNAGPSSRVSWTNCWRERDRKLVAKIQEAIKRIEGGTFGTCDGCGGEIEEKRLIARPVTSLCIDCKTVAEEEEVK